MRSYNYILRASRYYKIGITSNTIEKRISELQTGCPYKIKQHHHIDTKNQKLSQSIEKWLHKKYSKYRLQGEWFELPISAVNEVCLYMNSFKIERNFTDYLKLEKEIKAMHNKHKIDELRQQQEIILFKDTSLI